MRIVYTLTIDEETRKEIWVQAQEEDAPIIERPIEEIEAERIQSIKIKAGEIIKSKYSIEWQLNHPRLDVSYSLQYEWIDNIRKISNEAESNGTSLEDINWGI